MMTLQIISFLLWVILKTHSGVHPFRRRFWRRLHPSQRSSPRRIPDRWRRWCEARAAPSSASTEKIMKRIILKMAGETSVSRPDEPSARCTARKAPTCSLAASPPNVMTEMGRMGSSRVGAKEEATTQIAEQKSPFAHGGILAATKARGPITTPCVPE